MFFKPRFRTASLLIVVGQLLLAEVADALVPKQDEGSLESLTFVSESLQISAQSEAFDDVRVTAASGIVSTWDSFRISHGDWSAIVDKRTGKIESAEGQGIPFVPGRGNQLQMEDISADLGDDHPIDLARMEAITRAFLPRVTNLLGVDPSTLILNQGRSGHPADYLWYLDFDVTLDGMAVEGARVVFRVNNGNLIQFGSENLPAEGTKVPEAKVTRYQALKSLSDYVGGFGAADEFIDGGSQHLIPMALDDNRLVDGFKQGKGRGLARVWQFIFRRDNNHGTWRARIDSTSGQMLEFRDINDYATAQVTGGVNTSLTTTDNLPMPFADVFPGVYANSAGVYNSLFTGGNASSTLNGLFVKINDACGPILLTSDSSGNLAFGTSTGTDDCSTPGSGGAGNTRASRTQFYAINRAKEAARGWLNLPWLTEQLTVNVNLTDYNDDGICNAFWNDNALNLYKKSTSCSNSGEIQGVGLHELGHGLDANDGNGPSWDNGTRETYGDWTAALYTHDSCIGAGLFTANCNGYGDPCTSCTGVRDIDYAKHSTNTPHTVSNFTQSHCPAGNGQPGPCGQSGHCESYVSSEALWDLATRDLPGSGTTSTSAWLIMDRLWYLSRPTATAAFTCFKATSPWTSNGCGIGSLWKTMRAVDDDDGNLSNGTPHSSDLHDAFNRHGIACISDAGSSTDFRGCTQPTVPTLSLAAGNNQVNLSWSGSNGSYDIYRSEQGCDKGFVKIANDRTGLSFTDSNVANDFSYYYRVVAQPGNNEACSSAPSSCLEAGPCSPPTPPASVTANLPFADQIDISWTDSPGATRYHIYRALTPGGPYTKVWTTSDNTFSDANLTSCTRYYYVVRAAKNETCESGDSAEVAATTAGGSSVLTASKSGNGIGAITSIGTVTNGPIYCGATCQVMSLAYGCNELVTLTAEPSAGFVFRSWSGACSGTGTCTVAMTQAQAVTAEFAPATNTLTVIRAGAGSGTVTSSPAGIDCGGDCNETYNYDTSVTLTATPSTGSVFSGWSGACSGTGTCTVAMTQAQAVTATFAITTHTLTVNRTGTGSGTVMSATAGINCGGDCDEIYNYNTSVTLTATPSTGSVFSGWSGACSGTGTCTVTMTQARAVTATFALTTHTLTVSRAGTGSGTVTSSPAGIDCGTDCDETYNYNTPVTLTATPSTGSVFSGWNGACSGTGTCTVAMTQAQAVTATFEIATYTLTVSRAGAGSGRVIGWPAGINCGADCAEAYNYNTPVTLEPIVSTGSVFMGWNGACSGTGNCTVAVTQAQTVTATFEIATYELTVSRAGTGSGTVTSSIEGIDCGDDCDETYNYNTSVTLTATPSAGSIFSGWSGACSGTDTCTLAMAQSRAVTANFDVKGLDFYTVTPCRVFDSRITGTRLTSQVPLIINIAGSCGVPATATAVSLNVTAITAPGKGYITLYPGDLTLPGTSTINFPASLNRANNAVIPLAWNGNGTLAAVAVIVGGGTIDMTLDVNGYFE